MAKKEVKKPMSEQDKEDWNELYQYVRSNVLGYDDNQSLSNSMVLRLKGLLTNKFMENNNIADTANYSYKLVLNTFKFCNLSIQKALRNNSFRDENHKFNYIMRIVESKLNTVYMKMKNAKKTEESVKEHDTSNNFDYVNTFRRREDASYNKKYEDLW